MVKKDSVKSYFIRWIIRLAGGRVASVFKRERADTRFALTDLLPSPS